MIIAFFTPYYKFLQKDGYLKFFKDVDSLTDLIAKIKVEDKIKIYAYSKDIIKFQFGNTNPNIEYEFLEDSEIFDSFFVRNDKVKCRIKEKWQNVLGEYVYIVQDRDEQLRIVNDLDLCAFQATDINELSKDILENGEVGKILAAKMFLNDEEMKEVLGAN